MRIIRIITEYYIYKRNTRGLILIMKDILIESITLPI